MLGAIALGVAMMGPALGIYANLGPVAAGAGIASPAVFLVALLLILPSAASYALTSREIPSAGSAYTWLSESINPFVGAWMGLLLVATYFIAVILQPILFGLFFNELLALFFPSLVGYGTWMIGVLLSTAVVALLAYPGIEISAKGSMVVTVLGLIVVIGLAGTILASALRSGTLRFTPFNPLESLGGAGGLFQRSGVCTAELRRIFGNYNCCRRDPFPTFSYTSSGHMGLHFSGVHLGVQRVGFLLRTACSGLGGLCFKGCESRWCGGTSVLGPGVDHRHAGGSGCRAGCLYRVRSRVCTCRLCDGEGWDPSCLFRSVASQAPGSLECPAPGFRHHPCRCSHLGAMAGSVPFLRMVGGQPGVLRDDFERRSQCRLRSLFLSLSQKDIQLVVARHIAWHRLGQQLSAALLLLWSRSLECRLGEGSEHCCVFRRPRVCDRAVHYRPGFVQTRSSSALFSQGGPASSSLLRNTLRASTP